MKPRLLDGRTARRAVPRWCAYALTLLILTSTSACVGFTPDREEPEVPPIPSLFPATPSSSPLPTPDAQRISYLCFLLETRIENAPFDLAPLSLTHSSNESVTCSLRQPIPDTRAALKISIFANTFQAYPGESSEDATIRRLRSEISYREANGIAYHRLDIDIAEIWIGTSFNDTTLIDTDTNTETPGHQVGTRGFAVNFPYQIRTATSIVQPLEDVTEDINAENTALTEEIATMLLTEAMEVLLE